MIKYECPYCSMQIKKLEEKCPYCGAPGSCFKEIVYSQPQSETPQGDYIPETTQQNNLPQDKNKNMKAVVCLVFGMLSSSFMCTFFGWIFAVVGVVMFIISIRDKELSKTHKVCAILGFILSLITILSYTMIYLGVFVGFLS